jgi:hypothetical protein
VGVYPFTPNGHGFSVFLVLVSVVIVDVSDCVLLVAIVEVDARVKVAVMTV